MPVCNRFIVRAEPQVCFPVRCISWLCVKSCGIALLSDGGMAVGKSQKRVETPFACDSTDGCYFIAPVARSCFFWRIAVLANDYLWHLNPAEPRSLGYPLGAAGTSCPAMADTQRGDP